ncbi:MAG: MmgE/PrpD family protein [Chloroflexi bacterium]|nr:MmgE/PrpD family protein [Chloroflexota bacterium]
METTRKLVEFAVANNYATLPKQVIERAKDLILDAVGATMLGSTTPTGKIIARYVKQSNCQPEATIIGGGLKAMLTQAVFTNGSYLHSTELEADPTAGTGLPAMTIHASLGAAERFKASGKKVLEAFILGYEVQGRIQAASPGIGRRGFLTSMIVCTLGSAASTAKILGFDVNKFSMALGLAASQASGLVGQSGTTTHFIEMGMDRAQRRRVGAAGQGGSDRHARRPGEPAGLLQRLRRRGRLHPRRDSARPGEKLPARGAGNLRQEVSLLFPQPPRAGRRLPHHAGEQHHLRSDRRG